MNISHTLARQSLLGRTGITSHTGAQYSDGLFGPLIIEEHNNPYQEAYDSKRIVIMNDWFHAPSNQILSNVKSGKYMGKKKGL